MDDGKSQNGDQHERLVGQLEISNEEKKSSEIITEQMSEESNSTATDESTGDGSISCSGSSCCSECANDTLHDDNGNLSDDDNEYSLSPESPESPSPQCTPFSTPPHTPPYTPPGTPPTTPPPVEVELVIEDERLGESNCQAAGGSVSTDKSGRPLSVKGVGLPLLLRYSQSQVSLCKESGKVLVENDKINLNESSSSSSSSLAPLLRNFFQQTDLLEKIARLVDLSKELNEIICDISIKNGNEIELKFKRKGDSVNLTKGEENRGTEHEELEIESYQVELTRNDPNIKKSSKLARIRKKNLGQVILKRRYSKRCSHPVLKFEVQKHCCYFDLVSLCVRFMFCRAKSMSH